jgi:hypothetical protein
MREAGTQPVARRWQPMTIKLVGRVPDVIRTGGGKLSCYGHDPGEPRKQRHTG